MFPAALEIREGMHYDYPLFSIAEWRCNLSMHRDIDLELRIFMKRSRISVMRMTLYIPVTNDKFGIMRNNENNCYRNNNSDECQSSCAIVTRNDSRISPKGFS